MACISADGQLSDVARKVLVALQTPSSLEGVANQSDLPMFRVRASVREMCAAELLREQAGGEYRITDKGRETLELG